MTEAPPTSAAIPEAVSPGAVNPGQTLGIVGLVMAFFFGLNIVGLVLSIVGLNKSKQAGFKNRPALIGIIVSIVTIVVGAIFLIFVIAVGIATAEIIAETCAGVASGEAGTDGLVCP